jgi:hypothetical protein
VGEAPPRGGDPRAERAGRTRADGHVPYRALVSCLRIKRAKYPRRFRKFAELDFIVWLRSFEMVDSRADMPPEGSGTADRNPKLTTPPKRGGRRGLPTRPPLGRRLLRRLRLSNLLRRREVWIRVPRYQTAELWMVCGLKDRRPQPMAYVCPSCSEKEETRLLSIVLETAPPRLRWRSRSTSKRLEHPRILLRMTRSQLDDINAEFASRPRFSRRRPENRTDREMVIDTLVS